jgi:glutamate racemase
MGDGSERNKNVGDHSESSIQLASSTGDESSNAVSLHSSPLADHQLPIGVFDSGVGGLTVLRALREQLPRERFIYLGDTARLPYGTKSADSVSRYSQQAANYLVGRGIKYLVVACNTASGVALEFLRERFAPLPVIGVVGPGADAACAASRTGHIAVIATEGTIAGGAYQREIAARRPEFVVIARACSLFVSLAEEGWTRGEIPESIARRYMETMLEDVAIDTLLLGCTHFPVLVEALRAVIRPEISIVDSARTTASFLMDDLNRRHLAARIDRAGSVQLLATDSAERFARVGSLFLGEPLPPEQVEIVDLGSALTPGSRRSSSS